MTDDTPLRQVSGNLFGIPVYTNEHIPGDVVIITNGRISVLKVAEMQSDLAQVRELATDAWAIIANAPEENWDALSREERREIMGRWRDKHRAFLDKTKGKP